MVDWQAVIRALDDAGYTGFEPDSGNTAIPGLSGSWVVGEVPREGSLDPRRFSLPYRVLEGIPFGHATPTDPSNAPEAITNVAREHGLEVVIISVGADWVRIALCTPGENDG